MMVVCSSSWGTGSTLRSCSFLMTVLWSPSRLITVVESSALTTVAIGAANLSFTSLILVNVLRTDVGLNFSNIRLSITGLVVSLGFDAGEHDPVAVFKITDHGFAEAGRRLAALDRPTLLVQEGGYLSPSLGGYLRSFLSAFERKTA